MRFVPTCYITNCVIRQGYSEPSINCLYVAGIAPVFSVLVVIDCISNPGKTEEAICAVADSALIGVSPLKGAFVPS